MKDIICELEEQLRYADESDEEYATQLRVAIKVLKRHEEENAVYELNLSGLKAAFETDFVKNEADYMILHVHGNAKVPELIINPRPNFQEKLDYLSETYNEDLTLRAKPAIHIKEYNFVTKEELKAYF